MFYSRGLSLIEVLISLLIVSTLSLNLLEYNWLLVKKSQQVAKYVNAVIHMNNIIENRKSGFSDYVLDPLQYQLKVLQTRERVIVEIQWPCQQAIGCFNHILHSEVIL